MDVFRTTMFERSLRKLGTTAAELAALEADISENPEAGDVIKGLRGVRKVRFAMKGKGKSGGGRCIYLTIRVEDVIYLLLAYDKSVQTDLSPAQRKAISDLIEELS